MKRIFILSNRLRQSRSIKLTGWTIRVLEKLYGSAHLEDKLSHLRTLEHGTVGREIANMLDSKNYRLIPRFENHDLKHIVLDYAMTMKDEIRMQAYLVGNGNYTWPCLIFLSLAIFYPATWKHLAKEFKQGKLSNPIHYLALDNCMNQSLSEVKKIYGRNISTCKTLVHLC